MVKFLTYNVEVAPAFQLNTGKYWICNTNNGGSYTTTDPQEELRRIDAVDAACNNNLRPLIRMLKVWQAYCSVPIKSFQLELVAAEFLQQSPWREKTFFYFDWIMRDFFAYLHGKANGFVFAPGTYEVVCLGEAWLSRTLTAYQRASKACDYEYRNQVEAAGDEWQKIFGGFVARSACWRSVRRT